MYSVRDLERFVLIPTKNILEMPYPATGNNAVKYYTNVRLFLHMSEDELGVIKSIVNTQDHIQKQEFLTLIDTLEKNVNNLQKIIQEYKDSVKLEIIRINIPTIKEKIKNEKDVDTIISSIKFNFDDIIRDMIYGKCIRNILVGLSEMSCDGDWKVLRRYSSECQNELTALERQILVNRKWKTSNQSELGVIKNSLLCTSKLIKLYEKKFVI